MITYFRVQNYKALRDVSLELTPIHVLIGPNDSGKTSILEALQAFGRTVDVTTIGEAFSGRWDGSELVWRGNPGGRVLFQAAIAEGERRCQYLLPCSFPAQGRAVRLHQEEARLTNPERESGQVTSGQPGRSVVSKSWNSEKNPDFPWIRIVHDALSGMQVYRWTPAHLALPVAFGFSPRFQMEPSGFGLSMCLQDILSYDDQRFRELKSHFCDFFPNVSTIRLMREAGFARAIDSKPSSPGVGIYFELNSPKGALPARQASDGLLLVLAYLAIFYSPEPPRVLLIEEPENGVHPRRLREVLSVLKKLVSAPQGRTQVILTTHSPYVVDQFSPEEVTLCLKGEDGAVTTHRLSESKSVREQMDIFQLGEIWTAEGDEALATSEAQK